ncbi:hypothetical protein OSSY52_02970 [Tepiditoga spiralis]|uniref:Calcineurin-like phosphoesterase domain-containing protein n=1 Tax=Tepiditoga spiralis TaxID=2108365 RepID=A0A7G1G4M4_9BACT|nr:metallophosphoesterase family protein [Tepiditoga spiralis]BBE30156.1 hypothetical protein OSSY52_02970 [Tepiditoga spiralis]
MKKIFLLFTMMLLFINVFSMVKVVDKNLKLYGSTDANKGDILVENDEVGFIVGGLNNKNSGRIIDVFSQKYKYDTLDVMRYFISGETLKNTDLKFINNGVALTQLGSKYSIETTYTLNKNTIFVVSKIKNISKKQQFLKFTDILDYTSSMPYFVSKKFNGKNNFMIQENNVALYYDSYNSTKIFKIINIKNTTAITPKYQKLKPNETTTISRFIKIDKSISNFQKELLNESKTYTVSIKLRNTIPARDILTEVVDFKGNIISTGYTNENGDVSFNLPKDNYYVMPVFGTLNFEKISLNEKTSLNINIKKENEFLYKPFLTAKNTDGVIVNFKLLYPDLATVVVYDNQKEVGRYKTNYTTNVHHIRITGLKPNKKYEYMVFVGNKYTKPLESSIYYFKTFSEKPQKFVFDVYGDTRSYEKKHKEVVISMSKTNPDFVINTGDLVEKGNYEKDWIKFFWALEPLAPYTAYYPTLGNHEYNNIFYYRAFDLPNGGGDYNRRWYSFDYGSVHFTMIDSNISPNDTAFKAQINWLKNDLNSTNKTFKIVFFHHPFWTTSQQYGPMAENKEDGNELIKYWMPIFKQYEVDAVMNGHIHAYERYEKDGIVFITTGGGGAPLDTIHTATPLPWIKKDIIDYTHFVQVEATSNTLSFTVKAVSQLLDADKLVYKNVEGKILDEFKIKK